MTKIYLCFAILGAFMTACGQFQRHAESGYADSSPGNSQARASNRKTVDHHAEGRTPPKISQQARLQSLENSLGTKKEIEQYSKMLPYFSSEEERLEFLSQGNFEDKQKWLNERNFPGRPQQVTNEMHELVEAQDITLGMPQFLVKKSWGEPDVVEVSGNPAFRNERWRYNRYVSTSDGYKPEKKVVYFEGGRVVGWEVE